VNLSTITEDYVVVGNKLLLYRTIQQASFTAPIGKTHNLLLAKTMESASLSAEASSVSSMQ
jgi:hypothetical protein